jgi:hypothetical protein
MKFVCLLVFGMIRRNCHDFVVRLFLIIPCRIVFFSVFFSFFWCCCLYVFGSLFLSPCTCALCCTVGVISYNILCVSLSSHFSASMYSVSVCSYSFAVYSMAVGYGINIYVWYMAWLNSPQPECPETCWATIFSN